MNNSTTRDLHSKVTWSPYQATRPIGRRWSTFP